MKKPKTERPIEKQNMKKLSQILQKPINQILHPDSWAEFSQEVTQKGESPMPLDFEKDFFENRVPKKYAQVTLESCNKQPEAFHDYARAWARRPESVLLMGPVG